MRILIQALKFLMISAQAERGFISCELYQREGNETSLCFVENWQTMDDLECQIRSNRYTRLLELMEIAVESPILEFRAVSQKRGLDYLLAVRNGMPKS